MITHLKLGAWTGSTPSPSPSVSPEPTSQAPRRVPTRSGKEAGAVCGPIQPGSEPLPTSQRGGNYWDPTDAAELSRRLSWRLASAHDREHRTRAQGGTL